MGYQPGQSSDATFKILRGLLWFAVTALLVLVPLCMWGCPQYNVWEQQQVGHAERVRAEQNRQIKVLEAQAELDSAKLRAQSEVERARGMAESNKIIAGSLSGEGGRLYLQYLWIQGLEKGDNREVIYVPSDNGLPLLEAGRLNKLPSSPLPPQRDTPPLRK